MSMETSNRNETIVVVDDEKVILDLTTIILKSRGFNVMTASSVESGLALIERERPELVLLDFMLPGRDGLSALTEIRGRFPETYVIMFTGKGSEEIAVSLMKAGAADYILKPFNNHDLVDRITNVLRIREIELENLRLIAERERLLSEIEQWNRELENRVLEKSGQLERAQAEIVQSEKLATIGYLSAGMAHEIRNPLNSISLFVQLIKGSLEDPEKLDFVEKIQKEIARIDTLLRDLLSATKRPRFQISEVLIGETLERALESFLPRAEKQEVTVLRDYRKFPPAIKADPTEIEQIFTNLLMNALDEMPCGGSLEVSLDHDQATVLIRVSDTGGGIPHDKFSSIFDPFYTTKSSGSGLGLSVVLRIVRTYHGRISVESAEGEGSAFTVSLPLVPAIPAASAPV